MTATQYIMRVKRGEKIISSLSGLLESAEPTVSRTGKFVDINEARYEAYEK